MIKLTKHLMAGAGFSWAALLVATIGLVSAPHSWPMKAEAGQSSQPLVLVADDQYGNTPLHKAVVIENLEAISDLLAAGADLEARDQDGLTPLHYAASGGSPEVITTLLAAGADPLARDMGGRRPIDWVGEDSSLYDTAAYWQLNDATLNSQ